MNIFAHIKSKLSILEVINSYTTLKKAVPDGIDIYFDNI